MLAKRKFYLAKVDEKLGKAPTRLLELGAGPTLCCSPLCYWHSICSACPCPATPTLRIVLRARYAMPGTDVGSVGSQHKVTAYIRRGPSRGPSLKSGRLRYPPTRPLRAPYAMSGPGPTRCAVLRY
eukprot:2405167-Rhodomonas_salina.1